MEQTCKSDFVGFSKSVTLLVIEDKGILEEFYPFFKRSVNPYAPFQAATYYMSKPFIESTPS
jgi:hypothetical protein